MTGAVDSKKQGCSGIKCSLCKVSSSRDPTIIVNAGSACFYSDRYIETSHFFRFSFPVYVVLWLGLGAKTTWLGSGKDHVLA